MNISGRPIGAQLSRLAEAPDSTRVADAASEHWHSIHQTLSPIVGMQGVASLFRRSLYLARSRHPWLSDGAASDPVRPFEGLRSAITRQSSSAAATAQAELLQTFNDVLTKLIGESLTDRLLGPVWDNASSGRDAKDSMQ